jgi:hypothetical protein
MSKILISQEELDLLKSTLLMAKQTIQELVERNKEVEGLRCPHCGHEVISAKYDYAKGC